MLRKRSAMLCLMLAGVIAPAQAQTGTTYRFQVDTLKGTVWVLGGNARRELEAGEGGLAEGRVEIWLANGKQIFVLNPAERTYYEEKAFRTQRGLQDVTVEALTVRPPFRADGVENVDRGEALEIEDRIRRARLFETLRSQAAAVASAARRP